MICKRDEILDYEQAVIDKESPDYNIAKSVSAPMLGMNHDENAKELIAASKRGKKHSPERVKKNSEGHIGIPAWNKGKKMPPEYCARNASAQRGKKLSEEHKQKISQGGKGLKRPQSCIDALSKRMTGNTYWLGKKHAPGFGKKISKILTQHHEHNGEIHTSAEWAEIFGITTKAFAARLRRWGNVGRIYVPRMQ